MNRFTTTVILLFIIAPAHGQDLIRHDADSMLSALRKAPSAIDRIYLLLGLARFHIFKPGENKIDFDSATACINQAAVLNNFVKSADAHGYQLLTESFLLHEKNQPAEAKKRVEKAITLLESGNSKSHLGEAYYESSTHYDYRDSQQLNRRISLVEQAVGAFQQAGKIERTAFSLTMLGDLYSIRGNDKKALEATKLALAQYESINYQKLQSVYAVLGNMYRVQDEYGLALKYELKALKTAESLHDTSMMLCEINYVLGGIYKDLDRNELAIKYFKDALKTAEENDDHYSVLLLMLNIVTTYNTLDRPKEAIAFLASIPTKYFETKDDLEQSYIALAFCLTYLSANQLDKARRYHDILLKLSKSRRLLDDARNNINRILASYYLATGQYSNARIYLTRNTNFSPGFVRPKWFNADCKLWYKLDSAEGNFQSAFNYLLIYKTINDSLLSITKARQLQQIEVEYETAKKGDSLKLKNKDILLLRQTNDLQQVNLQRAALVKNVTISGIILTVIIIGLLYRQYRHKQQSNTIISGKNELLQHLLAEKDWLLKEIHHRVKNNFQTVMGLLGTQSGFLKNEVAINAIKDSQHRIHAMSLIHQRLYQTENLSAINMPDYIHELVDYLSDSFNIGNRIRVDLKIDPMEMDLAHCIPLGLILNEAITNSFKYAFPNDAEGIISISITRSSEHQILLRIRDDGAGLPSGFDVAKSESMGMNLMRGLSAEIGADFSISSQNGTRIDINLFYDPEVEMKITRTKTEPTHVT